MAFLAFCGVVLGGYFLGGLNGSLITSRLVYGEDIRDYGSKNAGLTNFYRTYGSRAIFLVALIDIIKTAFPVVMGGMLFESYFTFGTVTERLMVGRTLGGLFAMVGHAYPLLYKFKGGKSVLAGGTMILFLNPQVLLIALTAFLLAVLITRYVSLGSMLAAVAFPVSFIFLGFGTWATILAFICGAFVIYRHHENILRLYRKEERRLTFGRKRQDADEQDGENEDKNEQDTEARDKEV